MKLNTDPLDRDRQTVDLLRRSRIFTEYAEAFQSTTGLSLEIRAAHSPEMAPHGVKVCSILAGSKEACGCCLRFQQEVEDAATAASATNTCFAGLVETAVPIRVGQKIVAFLRTGQVLTQKPTARAFQRACAELESRGAKVNLTALERSYFSTRVVPPKQYGAMMRLLELFAQHLGGLTNLTLVAEQCDEHPMVARAKQYITANQSEEITLASVAARVHASTFYFCKVFKGSTGLTFTDYLSRTRVESAKQLLLNPHNRISEVAYAVGFQSLSQFNRVFRRIAGLTPSEFRIDVATNALASARG